MPGEFTSSAPGTSHVPGVERTSHSIARPSTSEGLRELLDTLLSLECILGEAPLSFDGLTHLTKPQLIQSNSGDNVVLGQKGEVPLCNCAGWREEKATLELEISNLRVKLDSAQTELVVSQAELASVRASSAQMAKEFTSFYAARSSSAELAQSQRSIYPLRTDNTTSSDTQVHEDSVYQPMNTSTYNFGYEAEEDSSLSPEQTNSGGTSESSLSSMSEDEESVHEDNEVSLELADPFMQFDQPMLPSVRRKLTISPSGYTRWKGKSVQFIIAQEITSTQPKEVAAHYLPDSHADCRTHMTILPLRARSGVHAPLFVDSNLGPARNVAIQSLRLVPIRGTLGEHGILLGSGFGTKLGNLVVVTNVVAGNKVMVKVKGNGSGAQGPFRVSSIASCTMGKPLYQ